MDIIKDMLCNGFQHPYQPSYKSYWHNATSSGKRERMTLIGLFPIHTKRDSSCGEILTAKYYNGFQGRCG